MCSNRHHNKALKNFFILSLALHVVFLFLLGQKIHSKKYVSRIEVDLKTISPRTHVRDLPRPGKRPKAIHHTSVLKAQIDKLPNFSSITDRIQKEANANYPVSPEIIKSKPAPVSNADIPVYSIKEAYSIREEIKNISIPYIPASIKPDSSGIKLSDEYLALIESRIKEFHKYPLAARRVGLEGTVFLEFLLYRDGTIGDIKITKSSNIPMLDKAAIKTIEAGNPYPPFPSEIRGDSEWISEWIALPITYNLTDIE